MKNYQAQTYLGFLGFFAARFFEVSTYFLVSEGIDLIDGSPDGHLGSLTIAQIVLGIVLCVLMRFLVVSFARRAIVESVSRYLLIFARCFISQS